MNYLFEKLDSKLIILRSQLSLLRHDLNCRRQQTFPRSGFIFTSHKCASSFIPILSKFIARSSSRSYIDYELASWHLGNMGYGDEVHEKIYSDISCLHPFKFLYAPLRSPPPSSFLARYHSNPILLFLRDPRDIAISAYYSFGKTHSLPKHLEYRKKFLERRAFISSLSLDDFVLYYLDEFIIPQFTLYSAFLLHEKVLYLRYSDYYNDTSSFFSSVLNHFECDISPSEFEKLSSLVSPVPPNQNPNSHQRSGQLHQFRDLLTDSTIEQIDSSYASTLNLFGFVENSI